MSSDRSSIVETEFILTEIRAAPEGSPYVYLTLKSPDEVGGPQRAPPRSGVAVSSFSSLEDMFQNLGPAISRQMFGSFATVLKLGLEEYEQLDVKVGDRLALEIHKVHVGIS